MTKAVKRIDMCNGPILVNIIKYTIPIICTSVLQLLFSAADLVIVGRFCGSRSVAAVGATNSLIHLFINLFIGMAAGVSVSVANAVGEKNDSKISRVVHTALPLAAILGLVITISGIIASKTMLRLMGTPSDILSLSSLYLKIYFCGMVPSFIFEFSSAICRSSGDTQTPLKFLALSGVINVGLNVVFVTAIKMNVAGVALATVTSQCVSAGLMVWFLSNRTDCFKFEFRKMRIYKDAFAKIFAIGFPTGLQSSIFSASNVIIQSSVNDFGPSAIAGNAAAGSIEGFVFVAMQAFHHSSLNYTGQNYGAKNTKRILKAFWTNVICVLTVSAILITVTMIFERSLLSLYITDDMNAIDVGVKRMAFVCAFYFMCGVYEVMNGFVRGLGHSLITMFISVFGVVGVRIVWLFTVFAQHKTLGYLYVSYPISWMACILMLVGASFVVYKKTQKRFSKMEKA